MVTVSTYEYIYCCFTVIMLIEPVTCTYQFIGDEKKISLPMQISVLNRWTQRD